MKSGTSCTMTISLSLGFGVFCSRQTFLTTRPAVGLRFVEGLVKHAVGVADRADGQSGLMECIVPTFDIEPREFLQPHGAEVRNDLVSSELPIALHCARGDAVRCGFPGRCDRTRSHLS
jgi:hypothetical protein